MISIADWEKTPVCTNDIPISTRNVYPSRLIHNVYDEARNILQKVANYTGKPAVYYLCSSFGHPVNLYPSVKLLADSSAMSMSL